MSYVNKWLQFPSLHREALKQSATDPLSGKIDVSILTTGQSAASRKRRVEVAQVSTSVFFNRKFFFFIF